MNSPLQVVIIGAGNVALSMAEAIVSLPDIHLSGVYNRDRTKWVRFLSEREIVCPIWDDCREVAPTSDLYIIAISDNAISLVVEQLPEISQGVVVHTSGAMNMDLLGRYTHRGILYPPNTFSREREVAWSDLHFFIEYSSKLSRERLQRFCSSMGSLFYVASSEQRAYLHLAAVFANNFTNVLYGIAQDILKENQLPTHALDTIILETALKIRTMSSNEAQTGPAQRNDTKTIDKHLQLLRGSNPERVEIYRVFTQIIRSKKR